MSRSMYRLFYQIFSIIVIVCFVFPNIQTASSAGIAAGETQAGGKEKSALTVTSYKWQAGEVEFVPGVVLVGLKPGVSLEADKTKRTGRAYITSSAGLAASLDMLQVNAVEGIFPQLPVRGENWTRKSSTSPKQVYRLRLPGISNVRAVAERLAMDPAVEFAEPDYIARPAGVEIATPSKERWARNDMTREFYAGTTKPDLLTIDDPLYGVQWGLAKIDIEGAWDDTYGSPTVTIAIIDSGIQLDHTDLAAQLWTNPGEIGGNGLDDDSNGHIDDVNGWNFVAGSNDVSDDNGHGTQVAGVAAAAGGNGVGIVGVCPQCRVIPVKVMQASGTANYSDIAAGVLYAAQKGAKVINLSLGGYGNSNTLRNAIDTATNTYGVVVVAGAGNDNLSTAFYPAAYENVLAVAGTQADDTKLNFSNYGSWVDVSAPGVDIRTTALGGDWVNGSGTSVSSPFAAGLAGLLRTLHPDWGQAMIRSQIVHTTDNIDSLNPTYAGLLGSGRMDAGAAMENPHPILSMTGYKVNGQSDGRPLLGATAEMTVTLGNDWWNAVGVNGVLTTTDGFVTMVNGTAAYGDIAAGASKANTTPFSFTVDSGANYNHAINLTLDVTDTNGYSNSYAFTVYTESGVENKSGTIATDETWTSDKTYLVTTNVNIPVGVTLTIQAGAVVKFDGNYALNVRGTLIADGTTSQRIQFKSNTAGSWDHIFFDDTSTDAVADVDGVYTSGSILRYVSIESSSGGIDCTTATPYLSHINLDNGGIVCSLGATPIWFLDNAITGGASFTGTGSAYRNTVSGGLSISGAGTAEDNVVTGGGLSLGSGDARRNSITGGGLSVGGSGGSLENNTVTGGNASVGGFFTVSGNTIGGSLTTGNSATVDHNTVTNGISVGSSSIVTWNTVEEASGTGLAAGSDVTAQYNRLVGNATGMSASTGLIEHNLVANNMGIGLQVGAATVRYNTFTGNKGNTIKVQGGNPVTIEYNNLEGNNGTYDLYINIASGVFVMAQHNWWGTTDNLVIAERIYDWYDDDTKATATFTLKLSEPEQTAPAYVRDVTVLPDTTLGIQTGTFEVEFSRTMDDSYLPGLEFFISHNQVSVGMAHTCEVQGDGSLLCWGVNSNGSIIVPAGSYSQVSAGMYHTCGLKSDGSLLCWGGNGNGQTTVPAGSYSQVSTGGYHTCGLKSDGSLLCWGWDWDGQTTVPPGSYIQVSAGFQHTCGLKSDSSLLCWGKNGNGQTTVPAGSYSQVSAGMYHTCGLKSDGSLLCWGNNIDGQTTVPAGSYSQVSAGGRHTCGLKSDGSLLCWGSNGYGRTTVPAGSYIQVSAGENHTCGEKSDGILLCWGHNIDGDTTVPAGRILAKAHIIDNAQWLSPSSYQAAYDITSALSKKTYQITVSDAIDSDGMQIAPNSNTTFTVDYAGFISDKTPPVKPTVSANGNGSLTSLSASWSSSDPESPITKYRYAIGSSPGTRDVVAWTYTNDTSVTRNNLILTAGVTYYVSAGARNEGGLWSEDGVSNGVVAGANPGLFNKSSPTNAAINQSPDPTLSWNASSDASEYEYCLDAEAVNNDTCDCSWISTSSSTSIPLSGLIPNQKYYWQVRASNIAGTTYANSGNWWSFTILPLPGAFSKNSPAYESNQSTGPTLRWGSSIGATSYKYCLDAEDVNNNVCNSTWKSTAKATSIKLSGLTSNQRYFWQVRAYNLAGMVMSGGGWWSFTARNLGSATLRSQGVNDGWVLESGEFSNKGGSFNATATKFFLGDDVNNKQYRSVLSFDTSGLPDDAVILSAVLKIKKEGLAGSNPFTTHQGLLVDIKKPYFGTALALAVHDFQAIAGKNAVGTFGTTASSGWYSVTLLNAAYPYINKTGTTQFRLRFKLDDDNDNVADYMKFFSGNYGTATDRPVLVIQYYVP